MPQCELESLKVVRPLQDECPVWYFLTGAISHPETLSKLLKLHETPEIHRASVRGYVEIRERGCTTLVPASEGNALTGNDVCYGWAYLVKSQGEETALRYYKTDYFTVTRCKISFPVQGTSDAPSEVDGLTFTFSLGEDWFRDANKPSRPYLQRVAKRHRGSSSDQKCPRLVVPSKAAPSTKVSRIKAQTVQSEMTMRYTRRV